MLSSINDPYVPRCSCIVWELNRPIRQRSCIAQIVLPLMLNPKPPNSAQWKRAAEDEYNSLMDHDTWELNTLLRFKVNPQQNTRSVSGSSAGNKVGRRLTESRKVYSGIASS